MDKQCTPESKTERFLFSSAQVSFVSNTTRTGGAGSLKRHEEVIDLFFFQSYPHHRLPTIRAGSLKHNEDVTNIQSYTHQR